MAEHCARCGYRLFDHMWPSNCPTFMADQSNEMGMVERVAQAIVANGIGELCWDVISDEHAEMARRQALGAIQAMRQEVNTAVSQDHAVFILGEIFNAMVGAALKEGEAAIQAAKASRRDAALSHDEVKG